MFHRFRSKFVALAQALCVCAILCWSAAPARGQNLAFTPGMASAYAGDPTQSKAQSSANYTGALSGLVLRSPTQVTFDSNGNAYLVDANGIRVVASGKGALPAVPAAGASPQAGTVYPVGGVTTPAHSGSNWYDSSCTTATDSWGNGCPATDVYFNGAYLYVDASGNIFVADGNANEIRVIYSGNLTIPGLPSNPVPGTIYVIAGNGTYGNNGDGSALSVEIETPGGVALDSRGNIYFSDEFNRVVRVLYVAAGSSIPGLPSSPTVGNVYTIAGTLGGTSCSYSSSDTCGDGGPATSALFTFFMGSIALDPSGNIYVADRNNQRIRAIYVAGTLPGISSPTVGDIYTVAGGGTNTTVSGQATNVRLQGPAYLATDPGGALYFTDNQTNLAYRVDVTGAISTVFGGAPKNLQGVYQFCSAKTDSYGDGCLATDTTIQPYGLGLDSAGNLYIADSQDNLIREATVTSTNVLLTGTFGLTVPSQVFTVANTGSQALQLSGISISSPFAQVSTGGSTDCDSSTSVAPGASCQIGIGITPAQAGTITGTLQVSSNSQNATSSQNTVNLTANIAQAASSTVLTVSPAAPAQVSPGQPITFTATVLPQTGVTAIPTGTVNFSNGSTLIGSAQLNSSGVATFTTSTLSAGTYVVTAAYQGDTNFSAGTSNTVFTTVASSAVPTVALTASPTSVTAGQSVTLTATVTPPSGGVAPTGTIVFQNGVIPISSPVSLDSNGTASFSTTSLPAGVNTLVAVYSGNLGANDSSPVIVTVGANAQLQFAPGVITTVAGDYNDSYGNETGIGGPAASAALATPEAAAYDSAGNLYIADKQANVVLAVASGKGAIPGIASPVAGDIYIVAGENGQACSTSTLPCGDGGQATAATLNLGYDGEAGVAIDLAGNLYITDSSDGAIRKVTPAGVISTVAGTLGSPAGQSSGDGGLATKATLTSLINAIAVDNAGDLYIADNNVVRKVDAQTQIITTVAGSQAAGGTYSGDGGPANAAGLNEPVGIALDSQGDLYISDTSNQVVREVNAQTGIISTVAGQDYNPASLYCQYGATPCFTGDGGPATQATLYNPAGIGVDGAGNLYISDSGNSVVRVVNAETGTINTIAGQGAQDCYYYPLPCGDGGLATSGYISTAYGLAMDSAGNFALADTYDSVVRQITAATTTLNFGSPNLGAINSQSVTVTNTGSQPLTITGITASDGFTQTASGGTDCTSSTTLAPAQQCMIAVQFFPTQAQAYTGTITVASNSSNATSGNNTITVSGTGVANSGTTPQTISFPTPPTPYYQGMKIALQATATSNLPVEYMVSGPGLILNNGAASAELEITGAGAITVSAYQFGDSTYAAASNNGVSVSLTAVQATLNIAAVSQSIQQGQKVPAFTSVSDYQITGYIPGDSASNLSGQPALYVTDSTGAVVPVGSTPEAGSYNLVIAQGTLVAPSYYKLNFVPAQFNVTGSNPQVIAFTLTNLTYGIPPVTLNAVANDAVTGKADGLPITYTAVPTTDNVTGNLLTISTAGPLSVTAYQGGSAYYASASATQSVNVAKAPLTVTAANQTLAQGVGLPVLSSILDYNFSGFVNQETSAVLTGAPTLTIVDSSGNVYGLGATPPVGTYTIKISQGSLASPNYAFSFVNGTFTVVKGQSQTVTFPAVANTTYGAAPIALNAGASSGLGVTYSVTPTSPAKIAGNMLTITGAGTVTVTATQPGNSTYAPASATQTFQVGPALLTVIAANVSRPNNTQNPPLTGYTITGFVNGDTAAVVSGSPALSTTALPGSPVGTYPIVIGQQPASSGQNPITAANYTFAFVNGTLTITPSGPTPDYSLTATPNVLGIPQGQIQQTTITLTPTNYYEGTVKLSCGNLPANMTCVFSPSALSADGTGNTVTGTLTINTNAGSTVVAQTSPLSGSHLSLATVFYLPGELVGLMVALYRRKRAKKSRMVHMLILIILLTGAWGLTACAGGTSSSASQYTAPGSYTVSLSAADSAGGPSHAINLTVDVQ